MHSRVFDSSKYEALNVWMAIIAVFSQPHLRRVTEVAKFDRLKQKKSHMQTLALHSAVRIRIHDVLFASSSLLYVSQCAFRSCVRYYAPCRCTHKFILVRQSLFRGALFFISAFVDSNAIKCTQTHARNATKHMESN